MMRNELYSEDMVFLISKVERAGCVVLSFVAREPVMVPDRDTE